MPQHGSNDQMCDTVQRFRSYFRWRNVALAILILYGWFNILEVQSTSLKDAKTVETRNNSIMRTGDVGKGLLPGDLPGYTGWARPEHTLAKYFNIHSIGSRARTGEDFVITVQCKGHEDCSKGNSLFFLRAYGPSVISGRFVHEGSGKYTLKYRPMDPGLYTVEAVLAFSNPQAFESFPLAQDQSEAPYEGYLLPGFPLEINVESKMLSLSKEDLCSFKHLTEDSPTSAVSKARWRVTSKVNERGYYLPRGDHKVTEQGYKENSNSLGIQMEYDYGPNCTILTKEAFHDKGPSNPFHQCKKEQKLFVVFIGDSTMRIQWNRFGEMTQGIENIGSDYINLYGGYRKSEKYGPNISNKLELISLRHPNAKIAIIFNTGLHDIHRLCASEWTDDRFEYFDKKLLKSFQFSCLWEYKSIIKEFADLIYKFPANLRIFQSTTAAWPKYGNYGIQWPLDAQRLPMDASFVPPFNDVAFEVLQAYKNKIQIMDGYWITHARPDNREVGDIGKKLSHPGLEVQGAMVRIWAMLILEKVCQ